MNYKSKLITVEQALGMVESNDTIVNGLGACEPKLFLSNLHTIAHRVTNTTITNCLPMIKAEYFMNDAYLNSFKIDSWFFSPDLRKMHSKGRISFIPNHLHLAAKKRIQAVKTNIYVGIGTMPDENGDINLGLSNVYEKMIIENADLVILEINPNVPTVFGDHTISLKDVDYVIEADYHLPELADVPSNDKDRVIGKYIADRINDGDCIQVGIGGIPNAVCEYLKDKNDLGVHTEMMTTGIYRLMEAGVINNSKKQVDIGQTVCCFAMGTQELYDFMHNNPNVVVKGGHLVNDPAIIQLNDNQVSINTCIEIDLTGQCCSESIGPLQFSGTGGQADTSIGAQNSKNGRSFIALYSTTLLKNPVTGEREEVSKIVPLLKPGAAVSLSRNDVDYVVTEYGIASLRGTSISERTKALINIAHPKFREDLTADALKYGFIVN